MPINDHYVIIGNGPAGNHAAAVLRDKDRDAKITIISDECVPYYYKPRLTRYISGAISQDELMVNTVEDYEKKDIRLRLGQCVQKLDLAENLIHLEHMETIHFTKLIIASGSRARVLPSMTDFSEHLNFVTSFTDAMALKDKITASERFFILGGDLVTFKFARMLKDMNKQISVLLYPEAFWPYRLNEEMGKEIAETLSDTVPDILSQDGIQSIAAKDNTFLIKTVNDESRTADLVISFNGLIPNIDFALKSGLDIDHGILVDEYLKTCHPDVYACGSCAQIYNPAIKSYSVSIGWPNAKAQGEAAAHNLLGDCRLIESVGRKYFDLEGVKIKTTWWDTIEDDAII